MLGCYIFSDIDKDPDAFIGVGPSWLLMSRLCIVEYKYYSRYIPLLLKGERPLFEAVSTVISLVGYIGAALWLSQVGLGRCVLFGWILPGRLAVILLAYAFDYLPHRPDRTLRSENEYTATNVTSVYGDFTSLLTWPLLHQNYHNIHHLAPYVPFYCYSTIWHATKRDLLQHGTQIKPVFGDSYCAASKMK